MSHHNLRFYVDAYHERSTDFRWIRPLKMVAIETQGVQDKFVPSHISLIYNNNNKLNLYSAYLVL